MKKIFFIVLFISGSLLAHEQFLVKPYVQLGASAKNRDELTLLWQTQDSSSHWTLEYRNISDKSWKKVHSITIKEIATPGSDKYYKYSAIFTDLAAGTEIEYRLTNQKNISFTARTRALRPANEPYRFVLFGDCGYGTAEQKRIAFEAYKTKPDFVMLTGDIVYQRGLTSEYRKNFWPVYNNDTASPTTGAPLMRSTLVVTAIGNHDIYGRELGTYPDGLAYFINWALPLNGPDMHGDTMNTPALHGPEENKKSFLDAASPTFPRMANYSFEYGNAHWTVIDANAYMDWSDSRLRSWLTNDLTEAAHSQWKFVALHEPPFSSSRKHFDEQRMRLVAGIFERFGVDVVFAGHVHNYQRSVPLRFEAMANPDSLGRVAGTFTFDNIFDGKVHTTSEGVVYIISGAGGAPLYDTTQASDRSSWQAFTTKFVSDKFSFTVVDMNDTAMTIRQLSQYGKEIDRVVMTK